MSTATQPRLISDIAAEIRKTWKNVNYAAKPYLDEMRWMGTINDNVMFDSGKDIVLRFLGNAATWRGEDAKRIKAELKAMLK